MGNNQNLLSITAFFSVLIHALIILGISFKLPELIGRNRADNTLDVVLINLSNDEEPIDADMLSTNNNLGGGDNEEDATSPKPVKIRDLSPIETLPTKAAQENTTEASQDNFIAGDRMEITIPTIEQIKQLTPKQLELTKAQVQTRRAQIKREQEQLTAKTALLMQQYQKMPRRTYSSPTTKQHAAAKYLDAWRKKIELIGNANYRQNTQGLSGSLIIDVAINRNGTINTIQLLKPSNHKLLNNAAIRFLRNAAPYDAFPEELKKTSDIIHITRTFHFSDGVHISNTDPSGDLFR